MGSKIKKVAGVALTTGALVASAVLASQNKKVRDFINNLKKKNTNPNKKESDNVSSLPLEGSPRLPKSVIPETYDVFLSPDLTTCKFGGILDILLEVVEETKFVVFNIADIELTESSIKLKYKEQEKEFVPVSVKIDSENELLILQYDDLLPLGKAVLHIEYAGTLNDQMKGFYRSSYTVNGESRNMAVTQFEVSDARRCFPCWDEPVFKATYIVTVEAPIDRVVLSNMPVDSEEVSGQKKIVKFKETPRMSTYLVAVVVGEFDCIEGITSEGLPVRVYTEVGSKSYGQYALDVAVKCLPHFTSYFGTPYSLPKLDMIAIPDFAAGAMENYGLITYRAAALLVDPVNSAASGRQRVAITVTHELAHQWFGNLVTMEWWTHLWLNEGFASWVSYLAVDLLFPEWNIWTQFNTSEMSTAFRLDGLQESHPIEVEVKHVKEIDEIFDAISYSKGASVIRMLQNYLGADAFQKGLIEYVKKFSFKNASTNDLWEALEGSTGEPFVSELMNTWTHQQGYPVLKISLEKNNKSLSVQQEQFLVLGSPGNKEWIIPVTLIQGKDKDIQRTLIKGRTATIPLSETDLSNGVDSSSTVEKNKEWIKVNVGQVGFYRVQYDFELSERLVEAVKEGELEPSDRFGLLDDCYALCRAGRQPFGVLLRLMSALKNENDYTMLCALTEIAVGTLSSLADALPETVKDYRLFAASLFRSKAAALGWEAVEGESHLDSMLRGTLQDVLISLQDETAILEAKKRFQDYLKDRSTSRLPPDLRRVAYEAVLSGVTEEDLSGYDSLLQIYRETELSEERVRILGALGSGPEIVVKKVLEFIFSSEVRKQDAIIALGSIGASTRDLVWDWLQEKWQEINGRWGEGFLITRFISYCCSKFSDEKKGEEIEAFFTKNGGPSVKRTVKQSVEKVKINSQIVRYIKGEENLSSLISKLASEVTESS